MVSLWCVLGLLLPSLFVAEQVICGDAVGSDGTLKCISPTVLLKMLATCSMRRQTRPSERRHVHLGDQCLPRLHQQ